MNIHTLYKYILSPFRKGRIKNFLAGSPFEPPPKILDVDGAPFHWEDSVRQPRVLVVSPVPPPFAGPEVMTQHLLDSPLREWYDLRHYNISKGRDVATKGKFDFVSIVYGFVQPVKLVWLLLRHWPVLVYTLLPSNLGGFLRYASFVLICAALGRRVVVWVLGARWNHLYESSPAAGRMFLRFVLRRIDAFIVQADGLKEQFAGLVPPEKLHSVYSGINLSSFPVPATREGRQEKQEKKVLFVGYLTHAKGALDLLEAVPGVAAAVPDVRFRLVGEMVDVERGITFISNPASNARRLGDLLGREEVVRHAELTGLQTGIDKVQSFLDADVFVLPSYSEAFPTVVLEAMAAGLPVVATPVGALPEVFSSENIVFVQPGDIAGLTEALVSLLGDAALRRRMGETNRRRVEEEFDDGAYARRVDRLFRTLLCRKESEGKDSSVPGARAGLHE